MNSSVDWIYGLPATGGSGGGGGNPIRALAGSRTGGAGDRRTGKEQVGACLVASHSHPNRLKWMQKWPIQFFFEGKWPIQLCVRTKHKMSEKLV